MKTFIIAEAGINHGGNINLAKKLADSAKESGADAVKYQTFYFLDHLERYELTREEFLDLKDYCDMIDIEFMSTPHDYSSIDFVDSLVDRHKIASPFLMRPDFLDKINPCKKPIIVSTGSLIHDDKVAKMSEITDALTHLKQDVTLLHCVSSYPCTNPMYGRIDELRKFGLPVGLSDHSMSTPNMNLPVVEKHFMLENSDCIDKNVSLTPVEFKRMVTKLRSLE